MSAEASPRRSLGRVAGDRNDMRSNTKTTLKIYSKQNTKATRRPAAELPGGEYPGTCGHIPDKRRSTTGRES